MAPPLADKSLIRIRQPKALKPAGRWARIREGENGGYGRGHLLRCPEAFSQGRKLRFKLECQDEKEIIGTGFHERAVIDPARFLAREKKAAG
jgi:hypothetical protein